MNEIKDCIDALLAAVQNSEEYQKFMKYKALVEQDPGLMEAQQRIKGIKKRPACKCLS